MDIIKGSTQLQELYESRKHYEAISKELDNTILQLETELVEEAATSMTDHIKVGENKFVFGWKNEYFAQYTKGDHSKKVELFKRLLDMKPDLEVDFMDTADMTDDGEIVFGQTANMHKTKFDKFLDALPAETIAKFVEDGLLFVKRYPNVVVRRVKG